MWKQLLDILKSIFNREANERRYMESLGKQGPKFKKTKQKTSLKKDVYGDPVKRPSKEPVKEKLKRVLSAPVGIRYTSKIEHAHQYLQNRWYKVRREYKRTTGRDLFLTCTWRSPKYQNHLFQMGRTIKSHAGVTKKRPLGKKVTKVDGYKKIGQHNYYPSRAFDVCVDRDPGVAKIVSWKVADYKALTKICKKLGLVHGGTWKKFKDWPHIQMPRNIE